MSKPTKSLSKESVDTIDQLRERLTSHSGSQALRTAVREFYGVADALEAQETPSEGESQLQRLAVDACRSSARILERMIDRQPI